MFTKHALFINGQWCQAIGGSKFPVVNPATGQVITEVPNAGVEETKAAIKAASEAQSTWASLAAVERSRILHKWFDLIQEHKEKLAQILTEEQGKPLNEARMEIQYGASFIEWYAEEAKRAYGEVIPASVSNKRIITIRQPVGVVAAITPWNFPCAMVTRKLAPALAAGCTVILKPAEATPLTAMAIVGLLDEAGAPAGVINLLTGEPAPIGEILMSDNRVAKMTFTGSTNVGKILMRQASEHVKKLSLELGGHAPLLVFNDADVETAVNGTIAAKFRNAGQTCISCNRIYVQEEIAPSFLKALIVKVNDLKVGIGIDESTDVGPLINRAGLEKVERHVSDAISKGAELVYGGEKIGSDDSNFYTPTILNGVNDSMLIYNEETFGPVIPIQTFRTEEQVLELANNSPYGLSGYIFTQNLSRAFKVAESLEVGMVGLNDGAISTAQAPFGGIKESGLGREGGRQGLEAFLETKYISIGL